LEHYFVGVKTIFFLLERKYGYLRFECSPKSSDGVTMEKIRNEDIVCLHSLPASY
jgi:hypothetical protein